MRLRPFALSVLLLLSAWGPGLRAGAAASGPPATQPGDPRTWGSWQECLDDFRRNRSGLVEGLVHSCRLDYAARQPVQDAAGYPVLDAQGQPISRTVQLTGRLFFPPAWRVAWGPRLPLVLYCHATELDKRAVPSLLGGQEWLLGAAAAAWFGFAVVMPDLPGMGGDAAAYHPFCHARSLAWAVLDALPAAEGAFRTDPYLAQHGYSWDGRLYVLGYSEGGYSALAAVKELETQRPARFRLTGSACMAGPFDLQGAMRATFIDPDRAYSRSYYLPYFVLGYHAVYGPRLDPRAVLAPGLLAPGADGTILEWADGSRDGLYVDQRLGRRLGMPADAINLRRMFNPAWLARELDDPAYAGSAVHGLLAENDLTQGWTPTRPILFCHSPDDLNIPYANTLTAMAGLGAALTRAGRNPAELLHLLPIGRPGDHIGHREAANIALPAAFAWFYYGMPD
jgi:hypothetical protein